MLKKFYLQLSGYKYRFVPWLVLNWKSRYNIAIFSRTLRPVTEKECYLKTLTSKFSSKKVISASENVVLDDQVKYIATLQKYFESLDKSQNVDNVNYVELMLKCLGFAVHKQHSNVSGQGVFVTNGIVKQSSLVALYPGTVYYPMEPLFFQSINNHFILKCKDGILIDGNDGGISKRIYKSSARRDLIGSHHTCDTSWLTNDLVNPLAIGQYVNNANKDYTANVSYQEVDIPITFPLFLMKFIPNVHFSPQQHFCEEDAKELTTTRFIRMVALIATRDIKMGEELFSSYFTEVHT